jgi:hypothetical protein
MSEALLLRRGAGILGARAEKPLQDTLMSELARFSYRGMDFKTMYPDLSEDGLPAMCSDGYDGAVELDKILVTLAETGTVLLNFESRRGHHAVRTHVGRSVKVLATLTLEQEQALIGALFQCAATAFDIPFSDVHAEGKSFRTTLSNGIEVLIRFIALPSYPWGFDLAGKVFRKF